MALDWRENLETGDGNFWCYVDVRGCVSAIEITIEAEANSHGPYHIAAVENYLGQLTQVPFE